MEIDAFLCDHAQVAEGKLFVNGAGIIVLRAPHPQPPYALNACVAVIVRLPWEALDEDHLLRVHVEDEDNRTIRPWAPSSAPELPEAVLETGFRSNRAPQMPVGDSATAPFALSFNFPVGQLGQYTFVLTLDGVERARLPLRLMLAQQAS